MSLKEGSYEPSLLLNRNMLKEIVSSLRKEKYGNHIQEWL